MDLTQTIPLMQSSDWRDHLRARYWQTRIDYRKTLRKVLQHDNGKLDYHLPDAELMRKQQGLEWELMKVIEQRAFVNDIDLNANIPADDGKTYRTRMGVCCRCNFVIQPSYTYCPGCSREIVR